MMLKIFICIWYIFQKVHRWLKRNDDYKANGRDNIEMAFMYSECGNEWTEVRENNGNVDLRQSCLNQFDAWSDIQQSS